MQAMRRRLFLLTLIALLAGCGGSGSGGGRDVTVALDWFPNPDHVGLYSALDRGLFRQARLDVRPQSPSDVSDPIKLVAAGRADLGISYEPELFFAAERQIPVVAVAALVPTALNSIIARGDEGIRRPSDLRGKTIGEDGSQSTAAYLSTVLRHAGLDPAHDVTRVNVGFNLMPALLSGRVDAIVGGFQNVEGVQARARGLDPVVFPVDQNGVPSYDELVLIANRDRLREDSGYRAVVRRFVRALAAGTAWARAHPRDAVSIMRAHAQRDYRGTIAESVPATLRLLRTSRLVPSQWTRFGRWMERAGLIARPPAPPVMPVPLS
jgi:putative hydroxymethylpyrimidine transport system substrate-binding protein